LKLYKAIGEAYPIQIISGKAVNYYVTDGYFYNRFNGGWNQISESINSINSASIMRYPQLKKLWDEAGNIVQWRKYYRFVPNSYP